ncbi:hypothetical protein SDC9_121260 [bioreactor metagenome]|uniref:Uncharacterized protein n=1 Tax=bioreactor metagenome TaxID=1076179 RepID=A0A645CBH2_9ZZZZ
MPARVAGAGRVHAIESLENLRQMLGGDARPLIGHFDARKAVAAEGANGNARLRRRVTHGVVDDVHQRLP